jgi:hypothetical protein
MQNIPWPSIRSKEVYATLMLVEMKRVCSNYGYQNLKIRPMKGWAVHTVFARFRNRPHNGEREQAFRFASILGKVIATKSSVL